MSTNDPDLDSPPEIPPTIQTSFSSGLGQSASKNYKPTKRVPSVWYFYVCLCVFVTVVSLAGTVVGWAIRYDSKTGTESYAMVVFFAIFAITFAVGPFIPKNGLGWVYGLLLILLSLLLVCPLIYTIVVVYYWLKKDNRKFFNYLRV